MTTREPKIPGADHPITIEDTGARVVARIGAHVIADTTRALTLREAGYPPVQYIPLDDVDQTLLADSATQTYCPYKGDASYYNIVLPEGHDTEPQLTDAVWSYREPYNSVASIAGHIAFYTDRVGVVIETARSQRRDQSSDRSSQQSTVIDSTPTKPTTAR